MANRAQVPLHAGNALPTEVGLETELPRCIIELCLRFPQVEEAYFQLEVSDPSVSGILGLLCAGLNSEQRFALVEAVAKVSRIFFDSPSAIEIFDDLDVRSSRSWELFKTLPPLYSRAQFTDDAE